MTIDAIDRDSEAERWFDVTQEVNQEWFRSYADELAKYCKDPEDVRCEVWLGPHSKDRRIIFRNRTAWIDFVIANWLDIEETIINQYGGDITFGLFNNRHYYIRLRIEGHDASETNSLFELLQEKLSLRISHPYAYKYRRSSIEFKVGHWNTKAFVVGIKKIADAIGPDPHIEEAYVKSFRGDVEELKPFYDQKSFCDYIDKRANLFGEVVFRMRARSVTVGIAVPSDHKNLRIRTSLAPDSVDSLIDAWPPDLKLDQVKAEDSGAFMSGAVPSVTESPWLKYGIPVLVAFITAASTAGVVSLKKSIWPDYKMVVASPSIESGKAKWAGPTLIVDWYLQPEQASLRGIVRDAVGLVRVLESSGVSREVKSTPPVSLQVTPGDYILSIDVPETAPIRIPLHIENEGSPVRAGKK